MMKKYPVGLYIYVALALGIDTSAFHVDIIRCPVIPVGSSSFGNQYKRRRTTVTPLHATAALATLTSLSDVLKIGVPEHINTDDITNRSDRAWLNQYEDLIKYRAKYGDCLVPAGYKENKRLANWVQFQRAQWKKRKANKDSCMTLERIQLLEAIDFVFEPNEMIWNEYFKALLSFKQQHGDCCVPQNYDDNPSLGTWVNMQRVYFNNSVKNGNRISITEDRIRKLDSIGFCWDLHQDAWSKRFHELELYKQQNGDCLVPPDYSINPSLGQWVVNQRHLYKNLISGEKPSITQERVDQLKKLGFCFDVLEIQWLEKFEELKRYKQKYGTFQVDTITNPSLAIWVANLRSSYKNFKAGKESSLNESRIQTLNEVGFVWNYNMSIQIGFDIRNKEWIKQKTTTIRRRRKPSDHYKSLWLKRFHELQMYKRKYGHCNVPKGFEDNPSLGNWVNMQRVQYKRMVSRKESKISLERVNKLLEIGFVFDLQEEAWNSKYERLLKYYEEHNDCLVRQDEPELGRWVAQMRAAYKKFIAGKNSQLTEDRIDKLNAIGFVWNTRVRRKKE